jgi:hypothetical protein
MFQNVRGDCSNYASNVIESEIIGNDGTPAVGAKLDRLWGGQGHVGFK